MNTDEEKIRQCQELGKTIADTLPESVAFVMLMCNFGPNGWMTYLSNAQRIDVISMLRELIGKLEADGGVLQ